MRIRPAPKTTRWRAHIGAPGRLVAGHHKCSDRGMRRIRVLIADAQLLLAEALAIAMQRCPDCLVLGEYPQSGVDAVRSAIDLRPDVAVLDYWLPDMESPAVTRAILARLPETKILNLSWFHGPSQVEAALSAGATGFLPKALHVSQLVEAVHRSYAGESPVFGEQLQALLGTITERGETVAEIGRRLAALTPRELEVLQLLAAGQVPEEVARTLGIAPGTVRNHIHALLSKSGARSQVELVAMARDQGLIR